MKRRIIIIQALITEDGTEVKDLPMLLEKFLNSNNEKSDWLNFFVEDYTVVDEIVAEDR